LRLCPAPRRRSTCPASEADTAALIMDASCLREKRGISVNSRLGGVAPFAIMCPAVKGIGNGQRLHERGRSCALNVRPPGKPLKIACRVREFGQPASALINAYAYGDVWSRRLCPVQPISCHGGDDGRDRATHELPFTSKGIEERLHGGTNPGNSSASWRCNRGIPAAKTRTNRADPARTTQSSKSG